MTLIPHIDRKWPDALVDLGPVELADSYWGVVGIPYASLAAEMSW